jgi:hypothetical protein
VPPSANTQRGTGHGGRVPPMTKHAPSHRQRQIAPKNAAPLCPTHHPARWTVGNLCGGCGVVVVVLYAATVMASCSGSGGTQDQSRDC